MNTLFEIGVTNAAIATLLAIGVWIITRIWRHPAFVHALWVVVLVKLVTPPMVAIPWTWPQAADSPSRPILERAQDVAEVLRESPPPTVNQVAAVSPDQDGPAMYSVGDSPSTDDTALSAANSGDLAAAEQLTTADTKSPSWTAIALWLWLGGSITWLVVAAYRILRFQRALLHTTFAPVELQRLADEVAKKLGVTRYRLRMTAGRLAPLVWPVGRPTVLISLPLAGQLSADELRTLLAHEFAHLRRKDHWVRWLELAASAAYWWHPVAWWARKMIHTSEEWACDAWVVGAFPRQAAHYAEALFTAVECALSNRPAVPVVASQLSAGRDLQERIENIMNASWKDRLSWPARLAVIFVALVVLPFSLRAAQQTNEAPQATAPHSTKESTHDPASTADDGAPQAQPKDESLDNFGLNEIIESGMELRVLVSDAPADRPVRQNVLVDSAGNIDLGPPYGEVAVAGMKVQWAEIAIAKRVDNPHVLISIQQRPGTRQKVDNSKRMIEPDSPVNISIHGDGDRVSINKIYTVDSNGDVNLGANYGRIHLAGLSEADASAALVNQLRTKMRDPKVSVLGGGRAPAPTVPGQGDPAAALTGAITPSTQIAPGMKLRLDIEGDLPEGQIHPLVVVDASGYIDLAVPQGRVYGRMKVDGLNVARVATDVVGALREFNPAVKARVTIVPFNAPPSRAAMFADPRVASTNRMSDEELNVLRDQIKFLDDHAKHIDAMFLQGVEGGSRDALETANFELSRAKAELALALGKRDEAIANLEQARAHAEQALNAVKARFDAGAITQEGLFQANRNLVEVRQKLIQVRNVAPVAPTANAQEANFQTTTLPTANIEASVAVNQKIRPGTPLVIQAVGLPSDRPIADAFVVQPDGTVALGPTYGRVNVNGLSINQAETAVQKHLAAQFPDAKVQITTVPVAPTAIEPRRVPVPAAPYHIAAGDVVHVIVLGGFADQPIADDFIVEPGGTLALGVSYGRVSVAGLTLVEAEQAIRKELGAKFGNIEAQVTIGGWQRSGQKANEPVMENVIPPSTTAAAYSGTESIRVLKTIVDMRQQRLVRMQQLAKQNSISISELQTAESEVAISTERLRQAENAAASRRLLIDLAKVDLEEALETNKKSPGTVSDAQIRRLQIKVQLAEANYRELGGLELPISESQADQLVDDVFYRSVLGHYGQLNGGWHAVINLSVPNKDLWSEKIQGRLRGRIDFNEINYQGHARIVISTDGVYTFDFPPHTDVQLNDKAISAGDVELKRGVYTLNIYTGTHGGMYILESYIRITSRQTNQAIPLVNSGAEIKRFLSQNVDGKPVVEISDYRPISVAIPKSLPGARD